MRSPDIGPYLRAHRDRCEVCGWHPETQGHNPDVLHDVPALRAAIDRIPPDPMTASRPTPAAPPAGAVGEPIVTAPVPPQPEEIEQPW